MANEGNASDIISRRGIYYPAFSIYSEVAGFYDYGPIGLRIKRNIEASWRSVFVDQLNALEIETTNILPEVVLKASGHLASFTDPIVKCKSCNTPYRADKLLEEFYTSKNDDKNAETVSRMSLAEIGRRLKEHNIKCPKCGGELSNVEAFNLLFKAPIGPLGSENGYLRPETAQGMFLDFKNLYKIYGMKLPSCIAQVGKAYRNEISPRQQLIRMREFSQMELELFFDPSEELYAIGSIDMDAVLQTSINFYSADKKMEEKTLGELLESGKLPNRHFAVLLYLEQSLLRMIGIDKSLTRFTEIPKEEAPHYSKGNVDLEIKTSYGFIEVAGTAYRTDYDLSAHSRESGTDISVVSGDKKVMPHVVEASMGLDRLLFALLDNSVVDDGRGWKWLRLSEHAAPYTYAVFPLQKDDKLVAKAHEIARLLSEKRISNYYSESGSIGKRYAKADEIGVQYCITVDFQSIEDDTFTVRDRDTAKQVRKQLGEII